MIQHSHPESPTPGLQLRWSWCAKCQRAYVTGTCRIVQFTPTALHPHPAELQLCPYEDCSGGTRRNQWLWSSIRLHHAEYPVTPQWNVIYPRSDVSATP